MTRLLQEAIAAIEQLPDDVQDEIAARLLADLADEQAWAGRFDTTSDDEWGRIAEIAQRDVREGHVESLEDIFPTNAP